MKTEQCFLGFILNSELKENYEYNKRHKTFSATWYIDSEKQLVAFVKRYAGGEKPRLILIGLNEVHEFLRYEKGNHPRSTRDSDIQVCKNMLIDIDIVNKEITQAHREALYQFLENKMFPYFRDMGFKQPAYAKTGGGIHILPAYPAIQVEEHSDLADRQKAFLGELRSVHKQDLENLEARIDNTFDLSRKVRLPGTSFRPIRISLGFSPPAYLFTKATNCFSESIYQVAEKVLCLLLYS